MNYYRVQGNMVLSNGGVVIATCLNQSEAERIGHLLNWWHESLFRLPWGERYSQRDVERAMADSLVAMPDKSPAPRIAAPPAPVLMPRVALPAVPPPPVILP